MYNSSNNGVGAAIFGCSGCNYAYWDWLGNIIGTQNGPNYRCAR